MPEPRVTENGDDGRHGQRFTDPSSPSFASEFAFPDQSRALIGRIENTLYDPCRADLRAADADYEEAIARANGAFANARADFEAFTARHRSAESDVLARIAGGRAGIANHCSTAAVHLNNAGIGAKASGLVTAVATSASLDETLEAIDAELGPLARSITDRAKPRLLPQHPVAIGAILLGSIILAAKFHPALLVTWPVLSLLHRALWRQHVRTAHASLFSQSEVLSGALQSIEAEMKQSVSATIAERQKKTLPAAEDQLTRAKAIADQRTAAELARIESHYASVAAQLANESAELFEMTGFASAPWDDSTWNNWRLDDSPEFAARIGLFRMSAADLTARLPAINFAYEVPALVPFSSGLATLLNAQPSAQSQAAEALQSLVIRVLANTPPGKARFTLIDPVGLGHNSAALLHLQDYNKELISGKAWTEPSDIERQLLDITEHMETVIQKYLRNEFETLNDFNAQAGEVAEPYCFVVVYDFPVNFSDKACNRLLSILRQGPRCGVYTFIARDMSKPAPYGFNFAELESAATLIEVGADGVRWRDRALAHLQLDLDRVEGHQTALDRIVHNSGEASTDAMKVVVPFDRVFESEFGTSRWTQSTSASLRAPLGPAGARKNLFLELGRLAHHALVVGRTGMGKTNLMHVIIAGLSLIYPPEEIQLYLIDFKGGVGFKPYAEHQLPHAKVIAIESEREFGMSVLSGLDVELKRRFDLFKRANVDNLEAYRQRVPSDKTAPRVLLIVDEFQEFFSAEDAIAQQARTILVRLATQGRSFGLHILLGTQSLTGSAVLSQQVMGQMAVRIALPCGEADSRLILGDGNLAARSLTRPGEGIYNAAAGLIEGNTPFQVAHISDVDLNKTLVDIRGLAVRNGQAARPLVFEGNEPAELPVCAPLLGALQQKEWTAPAKVLGTWVGEPVAILPPVRLIFGKQPGKNLLIVTRDQAEGLGVLLAAWTGLLAQQPPGTARYFVLDVAQSNAEWAPAFEAMSDVTGGIELVTRRSLPDVLESLNATTKERLETSSWTGPTNYLIVPGLHRARDLRKGDDFSFSSNGAPTPHDFFSSLLREGPEAGIHVLAWVDSVASGRRTADRAIGEFGLRIAGAMSIEDSSSFLDASDAAHLNKPHRMIFLDEDHPGVLQRFRPYAAPPAEFIAEIGANLGRRPGQTR